MKIYKYLIPIFLVVLFALSANQILSTRMTEQANYEALVTQARNCRDQEIRVDAENYYLSAAAQKPSVELYSEIADFYSEYDPGAAQHWGELFLEQYPENTAPYEFMMQLYLSQKDYIQCYAMADQTAKREIHSDLIDQILQQIQYTYYFTGQFDDVGAYMSDVCPIQLNGKWGYASVRGYVSIPAHFNSVGPFFQGLAPVIDEEGSCYFIDSEGNKKQQLTGLAGVEQIGLLSPSSQTVCINGKWGYYNEENQKLLGDYLDAYPFFNDLAAVQTVDGWMIINPSGENISGKIYEDVKSDGNLTVCRNDRMFVVSDGICHMIDTTGKQIGSDGYEDAEIFYNWDSYAAVKKNGQWMYIDKNGEAPFKDTFEDARSFSNGLAAAKKDGKWGFINLEGKFVIEPQFLNARDFNSRGGAFVRTGKFWELLRLTSMNFD